MSNKNSGQAKAKTGIRISSGLPAVVVAIALAFFVANVFGASISWWVIALILALPGIIFLVGFALSVISVVVLAFFDNSAYPLLTAR